MKYQIHHWHEKNGREREDGVEREKKRRLEKKAQDEMARWSIG